MNELRNMLADTVTKLFCDIYESGSQADSQNSDHWQRIESLGLPSLMRDEADGGFDGKWQDAVMVARLAGYYAINQPLVETLLGGYASRCMSSSNSGGASTVAHCGSADLTQQQHGYHISAELVQVAGGGNLPVFISGSFKNRHFLAQINPGDASRSSPRTNIAGEPRCSIHLQETPLQTLCWLDQPINLRNLAALLRCAQIAGSLQRLVDMCVQYASEREQFGRPISQFQVIQHGIAQLAEQAAAVTCATEAAAQALDREGVQSTDFEIAAAKLRANIAIPLATNIAHQVHGAIGFTEEHPLHLFTRRLLAWRSEYGNNRFWAKKLGKWCLQHRTDGLWQTITARSDHHMNQQSEVLREPEYQTS